MTKAELITIEEDQPEQRIDRWLRRRCPELAQGRIEKMCRKGEIRVDGKRVKASTRVGPGQVVRVPPGISDLQPKRIRAAPQQSAPSDLVDELRSRIIFKDEDLIVLNKPAGLAVQGGTGQKVHIAAALPGLRFERADDPHLVHRLDRDTSGLLLLARTPVAAETLGRKFSTRDVTKMYFAAVAGRPNPSAGRIRYAVFKSGPRGHERMQVVPPDEVKAHSGAKHAHTDYRVVDQAGNRAAWVALWPRTGRTHQLRVHMAAIGCPIAGDGKYGSRSQVNLGDGWGAALGGGVSRKLHLHAANLSLTHPKSGAPIEFSAPLPEHMSRTWEMFGWSEDGFSEVLPNPWTVSEVP